MEKGLLGRRSFGKEAFEKKVFWLGKRAAPRRNPDQYINHESRRVSVTMSQQKIGAQQLAKAAELLRRYKQAKANLERRIVENEQWYKMRYTDASASGSGRVMNSAWLFNSLANKHADIMDNLPDCTILPRERSDESAAGLLSQIVPVITERNHFEQIFSDVAWYKLKTGTGVYGVFWDTSAADGLGDVAIEQVDLLNLFWEPGVKDIQRSRNLFYVRLFDNEQLLADYPNLEGALGDDVDLAQYVYDDTVDTSNKSAVVDWYYKKRTEDGRTVVHLCKFCAGQLLYASENVAEYAQRGFYDHGKYPFVFDVMFGEEGTPTGFGYLDVMKAPQKQIDLLGTAIVRNAQMAATRRWFVRSDSGINKQEFADWSNPFVHFDGTLDEQSIQPITVSPLSNIYVSILQNKIDELKETSGNRDFSQGSTSSGVTAASAIAALQEAGSKLTRDSLKGAYRAYVQVIELVIELVRQFYTEPRCFRVCLPNGMQTFIEYYNADLQIRKQPDPFGLSLSERLPVFDVKVRAHKQTAFSRLSQNELAEELYQLGAFNPARAAEALAMVEMMDFEGREEVLGRIRSNAAAAAQAATATTALGGTQPGSAQTAAAQPGTNT